MNCENCGALHDCFYKLTEEVPITNEVGRFTLIEKNINGCATQPVHSCRSCGWDWKKE